MVVFFSGQNDLGQLLREAGFGNVFETDQHNEIADYLYRIAEKKLNKKKIIAKYPDRAKFEARSLIQESEKRLFNL